MLGVSVSTEELPGVLLIDFPEHELIQCPDDPTIPHLLLDDSAETLLLSQGNSGRLTGADSTVSIYTASGSTP